MGDKEKNLLSVTEAAVILGISRMHMIRKIRSGEVKAVRVGHRYIIDRNELGGIFKRISAAEKRLVETAVARTMKEYGDVIRKLGKA